MLPRNWIQLLILLGVVAVGALVLYLVRRSASDYEGDIEVKKKEDIKGKM